MKPHDGKMKIARGQWLGWQELPSRAGEPAVWDCTPALIVDVTPLKSGKGILRISFVAALNPVGPSRRTIDLRVTIHDSRYLVATFLDESAVPRTGILTSLDLAWIENRCGKFWTRFPADMPGAWPQSIMVPFEDTQSYLECVFGRTEADILAGTGKDSFDCAKRRMPSKYTTITIGQQYSAFDSFLIRLGYRPLQMDDKWFIYLEKDQILFRRSWTGILIYSLEAQWRGHELFLGSAKVNRNSKQYGQKNDAHDHKMLLYLIDSLLLRLPAEMPVGESASDAP